jgi:hypothetical protein
MDARMKGAKNIHWPPILAAAVRDGASPSEVARAIGVSASSVGYAAKRHGVTLRGMRGSVPRIDTPSLNKAFCAAVIEEMSAARFCVEHDISPGSLQKLEHRHGMKLRRKNIWRKGRVATQERAP